MKLSSIDLNLLVVLQAMLEEGSVARAAQRLHVTSPAISNALVRLRATLEDPLFVRAGRGLVPTPRALELAPVVRHSLASLEGALDGPFDARACTRTFTLALSDSDQIATLSGMARAVSRCLPKAMLRVISIDTLVSSGGLAGAEIDCAVGPPFEGDGLHRVPLYVDQGLLVCRRGHPRLKGRISAAAFNAAGHVDIHLLLGRPGAGNRAVRDAIARAGLSRRVVMTVPSFVAAAAVVSRTDFVTGLPDRVFKVLGPAFRLQALSGAWPAMKFPLGLTWHERTHRDPACIAFRAALRSAFDDVR